MSSTAPAVIDTDQICRQWREARGDRPSIATMNFIVFVENERYRQWVCERAQRIVEKHPSRMILLNAVPGEHGATVSHSETMERVDLGIDAIRAPQRIQYIESLIARDIPCVLWWAADRLFSSETFQGLLNVVQNVIVDSSGTGADPNAIREFASFFTENHSVAVGDLAWMRLDPWRDVVAQFFDDPGLHEELFSLRHITVASGSDSEALYLGCWLASRLGWTVCDEESFCDRFGTTIPFQRKREGEIRRVRSVILESSTSTYSAYVEGDDAVALEVSGKFERPPRHVPLQAIDNASLIERAILGRQTDRIFLEALDTVGQLLK
jgi:glucose-6-phosphate dehydrogenase assembly protein OpcA